MTPGAVASQTEDALHGCGLSRPKARYLLSLAEHFTEGALDQESWHRMDDDAVIERLVQMKGIGRWTAEMFLIFHLLRPDVLPVADIGIQKAIAQVPMRWLQSRSLGDHGGLSLRGISGVALTLYPSNTSNPAIGFRVSPAAQSIRPRPVPKLSPFEIAHKSAT